MGGTRTQKQSEEVDTGSRIPSEAAVQDEQQELIESFSEQEGVEEQIEDSDMVKRKRESLKEVDMRVENDDIKENMTEELQNFGEEDLYTKAAYDRLEVAEVEEDAVDGTAAYYQVRSSSGNIKEGEEQTVYLRQDADRGMARRAVTRNGVLANGIQLNDTEFVDSQMSQFADDGMDATKGYSQGEVESGKLYVANEGMLQDNKRELMQQTNEKFEELHENDSTIITRNGDEGAGRVSAAETLTYTTSAVNNEQYNNGLRMFDEHDEYVKNVMDEMGSSREAKVAASYVADKKREVGEESAFHGTEYDDVEYSEAEIQSIVYAQSLQEGASGQEHLRPSGNKSTTDVHVATEERNPSANVFTDEEFSTHTADAIQNNPESVSEDTKKFASFVNDVKKSNGGESAFDSTVDDVDYTRDEIATIQGRMLSQGKGVSGDYQVQNVDVF